MIRKSFGIVLLICSILPFILIKPKYVAVTTISSPDVFFEEPGTNNNFGGLLESFSSGSGAYDKKFNIFFKMLSDPFIVGKSVYKFNEMCDKKINKSNLSQSMHISVDRCASIDNFLKDSFEDPTFLNVGSKIVSNMTFTSVRNKPYSEIKITNSSEESALSIMHAVLYGIDALLKENSIKINEFELDAIKRTIDSTKIQDQIPYLANNYMKSFLAIEKSRPNTSAQYSHSILIEPYAKRVSTFFTKIIISFLTFTSGFLLFFGITKSIKFVSNIIFD